MPFRPLGPPPSLATPLLAGSRPARSGLPTLSSTTASSPNTVLTLVSANLQFCPICQMPFYCHVLLPRGLVCCAVCGWMVCMLLSTYFWSWRHPCRPNCTTASRNHQPSTSTDAKTSSLRHTSALYLDQSTCHRLYFHVQLSRMMMMIIIAKTMFQSLLDSIAL